VRIKYDALRGRYLGINNYGSLSLLGVPLEAVMSDIPAGYNTQMVNYGRVQKAAGATMADTIERRRTERWHNRPLGEKKVDCLLRQCD
jgi:hypothetical protein